MLEALRGMLLRGLRVPAEPAPPPGDPRRVQTFRAAPNYFRYSVAVWCFKQLSALIGLLFSYLFLRGVVARAGPFEYFGLIEQFFIAVFVVQLPFSFALLRLDFELRWYILSDRALRIREGILAVREQTMTFANIQNISIRQNPLQRLFGIATVAVRAAGGGGASHKPRQGSTGGSHEATFEGVDNGEQIRDAIRARIRLHRDAGLGDPEERGSARAIPADDGHRTRYTPLQEQRTSGAEAPVDAAHRLLSEVQALRTALRASVRTGSSG